jgi:hypothetical protein
MLGNVTPTAVCAMPSATSAANHSRRVVVMMLMQAEASTVDATAPFTPVNNRLDELAEEWVCDDCSEHCARKRCHMCDKTDSDDD